MYFGRQSIIDILLEECLMYLRKSRADDIDKTVEEVLHNHKMELDDWCERNLGGTISQDRVFKEVVSGEKMAERPELQKLLREIEKPNIKYIITNEPSRLSRGYLDEIGILIKLLRYNHITVITPSKIYNLEDEYDRENFERELKRGNEYLEYYKKIQKRGKDIKVLSGEYIGAVRPYGYNKISYKEGRRTVRTLEINQEEAEIVRMMFKWYAYEGYTIYGVAKKLNEMGIKNGNGRKWDPENGLKEILRSPLYLGKIRWGRQKNITTVENQQIITRKLKTEDYQIVDGLHEAIIDEETYNKAQEERKKHVPKKIKSQLRNPFAKILRCRECGIPMKYTSVPKYNDERLQCPNTVDCSCGGVILNELIETVCRILEETIENFNVTIQNSNEDVFEEYEKKIESLRKRLQVLEQTELSQWESQTNPDVSQRMPPHIFKQLNEKTVAEKEEVKALLENALANAPKKVDYEEKIYAFQKALEYLKDDEIDVGIKNKFLQDIFKEIKFYRPKATRLTRKEAEKRGIPYEYRKPCWDTPPFELEITFRE
jgi:DNA invertase Pin-like site-specific DNA recombinase